MTTTPKHKFPCDDYVIKIIGESTPAFPDEVIELIEAHTRICQKKLSHSKDARYCSLSVTLYLKNEQVLEKIYHDIKDKPYIKMIL